MFLLLADIFEDFRNTLSCYKLDPCHYLTSPGLSWAAMLNMTGINLDLITDIDMQLFNEKGMRGGISYIAHCHAQANNKYMQNFIPEKESTYITYLNANNLYGWAMSQPLPYKDFKWVEKIDVLDLNKYTVKSQKGIILEVELKYPQELHDLHNDYPSAAKKK